MSYTPCRLLLLVLLLSVAPVDAANVLLVVDDDSALNSEEQARQTSFESWGHTVSVIEDSDSEAAFDAAIAVNDVVYVNRDASTSSVDYKLRDARIGVVWETRKLDDEMGVGVDSDWSETANVTITDNTHAVTSGLTLGVLAVASSSQRLTFADAATAPGAEVLATVNGNNALIVVDRDGLLVNTYDGNSVALGRRVRMPWGSNPFAWTSLTADGLQLAQNAIAWAASNSDGDLVGHWQLDDGGGLSAVDSSSYGNSGALYNSPTWTTGYYNGALEFDGSNDCFLEVPHNDAYLIDDGTISFWIKTSDLTGQRMVFSKDAAANGTGGHISLYLEDDTFRLRLQSTGPSYEITFASAIQSDTWHHVVITWGSGGLRAYLDGALQGSDSYTGGLGTTSGGIGNYEPLAIGAGRQNTTSGDSGIGSVHAEFNGLIDDFRIYSRVMDEGEIIASGDFLGYWTFDDATGSTATDSSDTANDGALKNSPTWTAGTSGAALWFDGWDDYVEVPHDAAYLADEGSVWMYVNFADPWWDSGLFSKDATGMGNGGHVSVYMENYKVIARIQDTSGSYSVESTTTVAANTWYHIVFTWGPEGMKLFVNGVEEDTNAYAGGLGISSGGSGNTEPIVIGASRWNASAGQTGVAEDYFEGVIDDVRFYGRALTAGDINGTDKLIAHWKLDDGSGSTAVDSSGSGYDGTVVGSPPWTTTAVRSGGIDFSSGGEVVVSSLLGEPEDFTVAGWARIDALDVSGAEIINVGDYFGLRVNSSGQAQAFYHHTGSQWESCYADFGFKTGQWFHYAATFDDASDTLSIYINGELAATETRTQSIHYSGQQTNTKLGTHTVWGSYHLQGEMDDVRVYSEAISAAAVAELYGLVGHWKLDETSGTTAADSSPIGANGTHTNGATVGAEGLRIASVDLDGVDDRVTIPANSAHDCREAFAIAAWVRPDAFTDYGAILHRGDSTESPFALRLRSSGRLSVAVGRGPVPEETVPDTELTSNATLVAGRWRHVAAMWDGATLSLYIDGELDNSTAVTGDLGATAEGSYLGADAYGSPEHFDGRIDDVVLYNRAMLPEELAEHYGQVGHWRLNEGSGTTAADSSAFSVNGEHKNGPTVGQTGIRGNATDFDGSDDYVQILANTYHDCREAVSIAAWVKADSLGDYEGIFNRGHYSHSTYGLRIRSDGSIEFQGGQGTIPERTAPGFGVMSNQKITTGQWHHVVGVWDGATASVYVDGELDSSVALSGDLGVTTENSAIGADLTGGDEHFDGLIDDVVLYNRAMTAEEIAEHYGLVGHWKLDETSGTTATDSSPVGANGVYENGVGIGSTGLRLAAAEFDGVDDYVRIPANTSHDAREAVSIAAWVKPNSFGADEGVFCRGDGTASAFSLRVDSGGQLEWQNSWGSLTDTTTPNLNLTSTTTLTTGRWHHVAAVWDGATVSLYIDGELDRTATLAGDLGVTTEGSAIGAHLPGGDEHLDGLIDDVVLYNRAMLPEEIAEHFGKVGHWKLDETSGTTIADSSGLGNDGEHDAASSLGVEGLRGAAATVKGTAPTSDTFESLGEDDGDHAVALWVKAEQTPTYRADMFRVASGPWVAMHSDGRFAFFTQTTGGSSGSNSSGFSAAAGEWHQVVSQKRGASLELYIDGELNRTVALGDPGTNTAGASAVFGNWAGSGGDPIWFSMDDVVVYNRAMTDEEIAEHYGLVGYWKLDEASGTVAADSSPLANDGTYTNSPALGEAAVRSTGVEFNSVDADDYLDIPSAALDGAGGLSVAWWMKPASTGQQTVLSGANATDSNEITVYFKNATTLNAWSSGSDVDHTVKSLAAGRWTQFVYTLDRVTGVERVYRDGELASSTTRTATTTPLSIDAGGLLLGQDQDSVGGGFSTTQDLHATLDDVTIYNRVMTEHEIANHYGLLAHYKLDETSGTVANDSSVFANHTTVYANSPVPGVEGPRMTAFDFRSGGANSRVVAAETPELAALGADDGDFAVALWSKPAATGSSYRTVYQMGKTNNHGMPRIAIQGNSNRIQAMMSTSSNWNANVWSYGGLPANAWSHVVVQKKGAQVEIHINGELDRYTTWSVPTVGYNGCTLNIGGQHGYNSAGGVDDVRVYNRAMTTEEIAEHYGLIGRWRMEEASGAVVSDSSGMGNDGALLGSATWTTDAKEGVGSLQLDGSDYVTIPSLLVDDTSDGVTIAGWAKLTAADDGGSELLSLGNAMAIRLDDPGYLGSAAFAYDGTTWPAYKTGRDQVGVGWRHFAAAYDPTDMTVKFYINGVLQGSEAMSSPLTLSGLGSNTVIGAHGNGDTDKQFTGWVDDLRVYNRMITQDEVRALYYGEVVSGLRIIKWVEKR